MSLPGKAVADRMVKTEANPRTGSRPNSETAQLAQDKADNVVSTHRGANRRSRRKRIPIGVERHPGIKAAIQRHLARRKDRRTLPPDAQGKPAA